MVDVNSYHHDLIAILETNREMKKSWGGMVKQGIASGSGAVIGGFIFGYVGGVVGGIIGSLVGAVFITRYSSMINVLRNLNAEEKTQLVYAMCDLVGDVTIDALIGFIINKQNRKSLINILSSFV